MIAWWLQLRGPVAGSSGLRPWVQSSVTASFSLSSISTHTIDIISMYIVLPLIGR